MHWMQQQSKIYIYEEENNSYSKSTNLQSEAAAATQTMKKADVGAKQPWRRNQLLWQDNLAIWCCSSSSSEANGEEVLNSYRKTSLQNSILQQQKQMMKLRNEILSEKHSCKFDSATKQSKAKQNKTKQNKTKRWKRNKILSPNFF